ncbi:hypothetical protein WH47_09568 [Habropoda laboriosa]|uniref:Uncharacterized protein n=1 Tax=Habropoda laboriosa TaxID=597456 RepID=A0A0L7RE59_9HYME|nr:hypothetical protein WH47_09568 [Habropoda laboriosa]
MNGCNPTPDKFDINGPPAPGPHLGRQAPYQRSAACSSPFYTMQDWIERGEEKEEEEEEEEGRTNRRRGGKRTKGRKCNIARGKERHRKGNGEGNRIYFRQLERGKAVVEEKKSPTPGNAFAGSASENLQARPRYEGQEFKKKRTFSISQAKTSREGELKGAADEGRNVKRCPAREKMGREEDTTSRYLGAGGGEEEGRCKPEEEEEEEEEEVEKKLVSGRSRDPRAFSGPIVRFGALGRTVSNHQSVSYAETLKVFSLEKGEAEGRITEEEKRELERKKLEMPGRTEQTRKAA